MNRMTREDLLRDALKCQDALVIYAFALLKDWHLAEDAVQEAFVSVNEKWDTFKPGTGVLPWVRAIVRNKAIDIIRKRSHEEHRGGDDLQSLVDSHFQKHLDEKAVCFLAKRKDALQECMGLLHVQSLSMLMGFYRDRKSCEDLSGMFHKSVNAVRLSISRIRSQLRNCVNHKLTLQELS